MPELGRSFDRDRRALGLTAPGRRVILRRDTLGRVALPHHAVLTVSKVVVELALGVGLPLFIHATCSVKA